MSIYPFPEYFLYWCMTSISNSVVLPPNIPFKPPKVILDVAIYQLTAIKTRSVAPLALSSSLAFLSTSLLLHSAGRYQRSAGLFLRHIQPPVVCFGLQKTPFFVNHRYHRKRNDKSAPPQSNGCVDCQLPHWRSKTLNQERVKNCWFPGATCLP